MTTVLNRINIENSQKYHLEDNSLVFEVSPDNVLPSIEKLYNQNLTHLSTIIGLQNNEFIELFYPISSHIHLGEANTVFLKTKLGLNNPKVTSVIDLFPGAEVYENELKDLLGIDFSKNLLTEKFLLPSDFPDKIYPLRKEYESKGLQHKLDEIGVGKTKLEPIKEGEDYVISVGPQHPTHKEPIRYQFYVQGEEIQDVKLRLGFNHRGIEKALEAGTWQQNLYLIERICGICSAAHQLAYSITAEKIAGIADEIPDRAQWLRVLIAELERIHSHILWYGVLAHDAGYDMMFHVTWRDREIVMDLLEKLTGNRVNYSFMTIGGVRRDIDDELRLEMISSLKELLDKVVSHKEIMESEITFIARLEDIGVMNKEDAIRMNAVGPTARASNVNIDLRRDFPYAAYDEIPFKVFTESEGDVLSTLYVRMDETIDSLKMCIHILENLPTGEINIKVRSRLGNGEAHTRVEAPRGEDIHYIKSLNGKSPDRHKIRAPTLANITCLLKRFKGMKIADIPVIIRLIDPCIGCMERITFVDADSGKSKILSGDELIHRSNQSYTNNRKIKLFR